MTILTTSAFGVGWALGALLSRASTEHSLVAGACSVLVRWTCGGPRPRLQNELQATLQIEAGWPDEALLVEAFEINETLSLALQSYMSLTTAAAAEAAAAAAPTAFTGQMELGVPVGDSGTAATAAESEEDMIARAIQASLQVGL